MPCLLQSEPVVCNQVHFNIFWQSTDEYVLLDVGRKSSTVKSVFGTAGWKQVGWVFLTPFATMDGRDPTGVCIQVEGLSIALFTSVVSLKFLDASRSDVCRYTIRPSPVVGHHGREETALALIFFQCKGQPFLSIWRGLVQFISIHDHVETNPSVKRDKHCASWIAFEDGLVLGSQFDYIFFLECIDTMQMSGTLHGNLCQICDCSEIDHWWSVHPISIS